MAILEIVKWPDERLTTVSKPVEKVDSDLQKFMDDMLETMYAAEGIGLAAVQVGVLKRILVIDLGSNSKRYPDNDSEQNPMFFVNPEIIDSSDKTSSYNEGCLSFPGQYSKVVRPKVIKVKYLDYEGKEQILEADGLLATCLQHEMDHLNGIVFVDHISKLKRSMIEKRLAKQKKLQKND